MMMERIRSVGTDLLNTDSMGMGSRVGGAAGVREAVSGRHQPAVSVRWVTHALRRRHPINPSHSRISSHYSALANTSLTPYQTPSIYPRQPYGGDTD